MNNNWMGIVAFLLLLTTSTTHASQLYADLGIRHYSVNISESSFDSFAVSSRAGAWFVQGIGLEIGASLPVSNDAVELATVNMDSLISMALRLEGPSAKSGAAAFFLSGVASVQIRSQSDSSAASTNSRYYGPFIGFGFLKSLGRNAQLMFDFTHYSVDRAIDIPSMQISFRRMF